MALTPARSSDVETTANRRASVLLASASAAGTLAAVRALTSNGFKVDVLANGHFCAAAWSRHVRQTHAFPPEFEAERCLERLIEIGKAEPGRILLPTSDAIAWLYTRHADELARYFCVYQPSLRTIQRILDKNLFASAALRANVSTLPSWDPMDLDELGRLAPSLPYPILIKPRTHVHRFQNDKGLVSTFPDELLGRYRQYLLREEYRPARNELMPDARRPILQQFVNLTNEGVCSVSGFIDRSGELFVTRRSTKILLRSYPVGVGVCFESLPADSYLNEAVRRLCRELGYFGMFEVEFLRFNEGWAVIDFNPRLFNQVGLDIYRGMSLPLFVCLDAANEKSALQRAVSEAQSKDDNAPGIFCDRFTLRMLLLARQITARISADELAYWRRWVKENAAHCVDVAADANDPLPAAVHAISETYLGLKALPRFLRLVPRVPPTGGQSPVRISR